MSILRENRNNKSDQTNQFRLSRLGARNVGTFLLLTAPAIIIFAMMMLWPVVNMFQVSTLKWPTLLKPSQFVGIQNYIRLFQDPKFYIALKNTGIHVAIMLLFSLPVGFVLGFFLSQLKNFSTPLRTIYFTPAMLSAPALAMTFLGIYLPDGILNFFLTVIGLESLAKVWLANYSTALGAVIAVDVWSAIGFYAVLYYAILAELPQELYEAARLDGAGYWTLMWRIAFPLILDFYGVTVMLAFIWALTGSAQLILLLTKGGPGTASLTISYYLYESAFFTRKIGYSQAIGVVLFIVGLVGMVAIRRIFRRRY